MYGIVNTLDELQLEEKYMSNKITLESFQQMLIERVIPNYEDWYFRDVNPDDEEAVEEAKVQYIKDDFCEVIIGGVEDIQGFSLIEQDGGGEGGSEYCYSIVKLDDVFYKISYSYYSHHGFEFDYAEVRKVEPKKKMITVYE